MSNFKLGYNTIQHIATATANLTASTTRVLTNLFSGSRSERFELATASTDILTVNYDLGASTTKTANFLAIMRAKLLHRNDCTGVRLRGSTQSATLPSTLSPTAWFDPNRGVTTVSGAVSQWNDLSGNNYHATQGAAASRPILSRADNQENRILYSEDIQQANWVTVAGTKTGQTFFETTANSNHALDQAITLVAGTTYIYEVEALSIGGRNISIGSATEGSARYNLTTGAVITTSGVFSSSTPIDMGGGYWKVVGTFVCSTTSNHIYLYSMDGTNTSFIGDVAKGIAVRKMAIRRSTNESTYVQTISYPQYSGINGNRALVFDGNDYLLANSVAAAVTGTDKPYTLFFLANCFSSAATSKSLLSFGRASSATPYIVHRYYQTYIDSAMRDDASTTVNPAFNGVAPTNNEVITIKTTGTSLTIYKNGTAISTQGFDVGATTLDTFAIGTLYRNGAVTAGNEYTGYIGEVLVFNSALSDADRQAVEAYLTTKYIITPLVQLDELSTTTLMGPNDEDYFSVFTESAAFRHWWLELVNEGTATKYNCSKVFFGKALDFGRDPKLPVSIDQSRKTPWSREAALSTTLEIGPISDTDKETLINSVLKYSDVLPVVALDPGAYVFNDTKGMHCKIVDHNVDPYFGADNDISLTLEEEI